MSELLVLGPTVLELQQDSEIPKDLEIEGRGIYLILVDLQNVPMTTFLWSAILEQFQKEWHFDRLSENRRSMTSTMRLKLDGLSSLINTKVQSENSTFECSRCGASTQTGFPNVWPWNLRSRISMIWLEIHNKTCFVNSMCAKNGALCLAVSSRDGMMDAQ